MCLHWTPVLAVLDKVHNKDLENPGMFSSSPRKFSIGCKDPGWLLRALVSPHCSSPNAVI